MTRHAQARIDAIHLAATLADAAAMIRNHVNEGAYIEALGIHTAMLTARLDMELNLRKAAALETEERNKVA